MTSPSGSYNGRCKCGGYVDRAPRRQGVTLAECARCGRVWTERTQPPFDVEIQRYRRRQKAKKKGRA